MFSTIDNYIKSTIFKFIALSDSEVTYNIIYAFEFDEFDEP